VLAVVFAAGFPAAAIAQTTTVSGGQFRNRQVVDQSLLHRGRMEIALSLAGAMSFGSVTPEGGTTSSQSSIYVTPAVVGGYMLTDNIELRLSLGAQLVSQTVNDQKVQSTTSFVGALQGLYQRDLVLGLAWYAGVGAGGFYGNRDVLASAMTRLRYTNVGGLGQVLLGLLMQPGPTVLLRGGVRADFLFGSDSPEDAMLAAKTSFFNTQIVFELSLGWRFG
jgi:hypothetical protein